MIEYNSFAMQFGVGMCKDCYQPTCRNCNEEVDEDGKWCSKYCYDEYFSE